MDISVLSNNLIIFAVLMLIGFVAVKTRAVNKQVVEAVSLFVIRVVMPAMVFSMISSTAERSMLLRSIPFLIAAYVAYLLFAIVGFISGKAARLKGDTFKLHIAQCMFNNEIYMGTVLVGALLGSSGLFYLSLYIIVTSTLLWTFGVYLTSGGSQSKGILGGVGKMINPATGAMVAGMMFVILDIRPMELDWVIFGMRPVGTIFEAIRDLGNTAPYIAMVYVGAALALMKVARMINRLGTYFIVIFKMMLCPIVIYSVLWLLRGVFDFEARMVLTIIASLPGMVTVTMLAEANGSDAEYGAAATLVTTVLGLFTMPIVFAFLNWLF